MVIPALIIATLFRKQDFAVPAGASPEFRKLALSIEDAIVAKDFSTGAKLVAFLPNQSISYHVDLTKVPKAQKASMKTVIDNSAKVWLKSLGEGVTLSPSQSPSADIRFDFEPAVSTSWQWLNKTLPAKLEIKIPINRSPQSVAKDAQISFDRYCGVGTAKSDSTREKGITTAQKVLSLSKYLRDVIQSRAPDFRVPAGASIEFHHLVLDIENALSAKDFAMAEKLSGQLPSNEVTWSLDSHKLDSDQKVEFTQVAETAQQNWSKALGGEVSFKRISTGKADIAISFEPVLAKISGTNEIAGAAFFLGADPTQPKVEAVIGLKRGPSLSKIIGREVFNESQFAFGRYLGLAPNPQLGSAMGRIESQMIASNSITIQDAGAVKKILSLSHQLRDAIQKKQVIESGQPAMKLERNNLEFKDAIQGDDGQAQMLLTNTGTSMLELEIRGDCGCISGTVPETVAPGKSTLLTGLFKTAELNGDVHHNLILKSNDPDHPIMVIPVKISVIPRAEAVFPETNTIYVDRNEKELIYYLNSAEQKLFNISDVTVIGMPVTVRTERFDGEVPNYLILGKKQTIHGYKVFVDASKLTSRDVFGRSYGTVYLKTDNPKINFIKTQFFVQNGIVSLPDSIYFGTPLGIADSTFALIRTGRPFKILKITSDSKYLTFEIKGNTPENASTYMVRVIYDGKAPGHRFKGTVIVQTDDPQQSVIKIPFQTNQI